MNVTITGATGLIGKGIVKALRERGDEVTVLSRDPSGATAKLGIPAVAWNATEEPAPAEAIRGRQAIVHLAGEPVAQRWTPSTRTAIRDSREAGTRNLVAAIAATDASERPAVPKRSSNSDFTAAISRLKTSCEA